MKLSISPEELKNGALVKKWGEKRLSEIRDELCRNRPIALTRPWMLNDRRICAVFPYELITSAENTVLMFRPIWCQVMIGCHLRSPKIRVVVAKFDHGQFEFNEVGELSSKATMSGPGVDPSVVEDSEIMLAKLLEKNEHTPVQYLLRHIQQRFGSKQMEVAA